MRVRALILTTVILAATGCGGTAGGSDTTASTSPDAVSPTSGPPLASPIPSVLASPAAEAPVPVCNDRKPPWVEAANSAKDGPDPAGRIVFGQVSRDDVPFQVVDPLFAIDPDGSDLVQILSCDMERSRISHDGTRLAFSIFMSDGTWQIATSAIDGTDLRILTATSGWAEMPDWAPDDSWLGYAYSPTPCAVATCDVDGTFRPTIWRVNADGSDPRLIGNPDAFDSEPRLSPDGREVIFHRWDASKQLEDYLIRDLATGTERRVTTSDAGIQHPDWSRDGRSIIYNTHPDASGPFIQTVPADDPAAKPVRIYGDAEHTGFKPAYSPDGARIVFGCDGNLCLMNADGSKVVTLVGPVGFELNHFAWGVNAR